MIKQVSHSTAADSPAGFSLALAVAYELHAPTQAQAAEAAVAPAPRAPEVAPAPQLMGLRTSAARPHQRKVPLSRMTLVRG
ncbi:hypothetical protein [Streptomyces fuscichromogenes]|uniref:Uncharacterized protein n=1 Tax=Streptomyces fuscichromogenes TaxID=1324013 RepID=A0A917XIE3_9ACTN|nr:hypothetical protein [Streptomyces fuscichromogenes]GGN25518.1 hypothetical protein GCM10011578_059490 [Streptomyces fuscichromogenes]